jgi:arylsulfatase A
MALEIVFAQIVLLTFSPCAIATDSRPPNILLIVADDLGSAELGCYGQEKIETPFLDQLAREGQRATAAYSAAPVCAPSRCALLTGRDMGHAAIRDNRAAPPNCEVPLPADEFTLAESLHARGYRTACIGKWGLGNPESEGSPLRQGFDRFFGYYCQLHAHDHYTDHLYDDATRIDIAPGTYAPDRFLAESLAFLDASKSEPLFLYFASTVPHLALQVPEDSLAEYRGKFEEDPYDGKKGYRAHSTPRAAYAAMVTRFDRDVGALLLALDELGIANDTIVIVTSDNGATFDVGGADTRFFRGNGELRGHKGELYEGGIRVPFLLRWPGRVKPGSTHGNPVAHFDLFLTLASLCGAAPPKATEGSNLEAVWRTGDQLPERALYFEHPAGNGWRAVRHGKWKLVVRGERKPNATITRELYDLEADPSESTNRIEDESSALFRLNALLTRRTKSPIADWNYP